MIKQYGTHHFDVKDVVAIEERPGACCRVQLRHMDFIVLKGQAAKECLDDFLKRDDYHWSKKHEFKENNGHL